MTAGKERPITASGKANEYRIVLTKTEARYSEKSMMALSVDLQNLIEMELKMNALKHEQLCAENRTLKRSARLSDESVRRLVAKEELYLAETQATVAKAAVKAAEKRNCFQDTQRQQWDESVRVTTTGAVMTVDESLAAERAEIFNDVQKRMVRYLLLSEKHEKVQALQLLSDAGKELETAETADRQTQSVQTRASRRRTPGARTTQQNPTAFARAETASIELTRHTHA
jgi:hypothetical protein